MKLSRVEFTGVAIAIELESGNNSYMYACELH